MITLVYSRLSGPQPDPPPGEVPERPSDPPDSPIPPDPDQTRPGNVPPDSDTPAPPPMPYPETPRLPGDPQF